MLLQRCDFGATKESSVVQQLGQRMLASNRALRWLHDFGTLRLRSGGQVELVDAAARLAQWKKGREKTHENLRRKLTWHHG